MSGRLKVDSLNGSALPLTHPTTIYSGGGSQYAINGQSAGSWYYRVKASNAGGDSGWSNVESVTVASAPTVGFVGGPTSGPNSLRVTSPDGSDTEIKID